MTRWMAGLLALGSLAWALDSVREVRSARPFAPMTVLPIMDRGYLFFITHDSPELDVYTPSGQLGFATTIQAPNQTVPKLFEAAIDHEGNVAVSISYRGAASKVQSAIVLLDAAGKQKGIILTGLYMPTHLCFAADGWIWSSGWLLDAVRGNREDREEDYSIIRRYDPQAMRETGAFIKRSSFPAGLTPGGEWGGGWGIRAAGDRIGALLYSGMTGARMVWLEMDTSGKETRRWTLPAGHTDGLAFTPKGLYTAQWKLSQDKTKTTWELDEFDQASSTWKAITSTEFPIHQPCNCGYPMDADGDDIVLAKQSGAILEWVKP